MQVVKSAFSKTFHQIYSKIIGFQHNHGDLSSFVAEIPVVLNEVFSSSSKHESVPEALTVALIKLSTLDKNRAGFSLIMVLKFVYDLKKGRVDSLVFLIMENWSYNSLKSVTRCFCKQT